MAELGMTVLQIIGAVIMLIASLCMICFVMMQESKQQNGLGALTGESTDAFSSRNFGKTKEAFYAKLTKILAIIFFVVALAMNLFIRFGW